MCAKITASTTSEVKNDHAHAITQGICNKFIEVNFCVGCMVSQPNCLFQRSTTMSLINKIHIIFTCNPIIFEDIYILLFHSIQDKMLQCENVFRWILVGKTSVRIKWQTDSNYVTLWGKNCNFERRKECVCNAFSQNYDMFDWGLHDLSNWVSQFLQKFSHFKVSGKIRSNQTCGK